MSNTEEILKQFGENARNSVELTSHEKQLNRDKLIKFMDNYSPDEEAVQKEESIPRPFYFSFFNYLKPAYVALTLIVIVGSTGIVLASQNALPGNLLYPFKTQILEKIQTSLANSPEEKAQVNMNLATKRLNEAEALVEKNELTPEISKDLTDHFEEKGKEMEKALMLLQNDQKNEVVQQVSRDFSTVLKQHRDTLNTLHRVSASRQSSFRPQKITLPKSNLESVK